MIGFIFKITTYVFIMGILCFRGNVAEKNKINFISDVITSYSKTSVVNVYICDKQEQYSLLKMISLYGMVNVNNVSTNNLPNFPIDTLFIIDAECSFYQKLIREANISKLFNSPYRWLIVSNSTTGNILTSLLNTSILTNSEVIVSNYINDKFLLNSIYKIRQWDNEFNIDETGTWDAKNGLKLNELKYVKSIQRNNMKLGLLKTSIVITDNDTLEHLEDYRFKHIDSITKVNYIFLKHLSQFVNASLEFSFDTTWGYFNSTTSQWSGMIGRLHRREVDIGGTPLFFTPDRISVIDYIAMTTATRSKFVFRQPKLSYVANVYTLPFYWTVWTSICLLLVIIIMALYVVSKWETKILNNQISDHSTHLKDSLLDIVFLCFGAVCQQGGVTTPFGLSGRVTVVLLFTTFMFLYSSYSANIVSLLQSPSTKIRTLEDLLHSRLGFGVHETVFSHFYFSTATEPVHKAIYEQKVAPKGHKARWMNLSEGIQRMRDGLFAFHFEEGPGYKLIQESFLEHEKCGLMDIPYLELIDPYLAVQKNTSFREIFKIGLKRIQESGLQSREVNRIYTRKPVCNANTESFVSVGLIDCYPVALLFVAGLLCSSFVFILELIVYQYV